MHWSRLQHAIKLAGKLHARSIMYANKLLTTRRAIENNNTSHSEVLEMGASTQEPSRSIWDIPISIFLFFSFVHTWCTILKSSTNLRMPLSPVCKFSKPRSPSFGDPGP
eukprot:1150511-Pelagomonas_calceolata.AAC.2